MIGSIPLPRRANPLSRLVALTLLALVLTLVVSDRASAAACSTSTGASSCAITANLTVTAGTLALETSPSLYWSFVGTSYDQWASGSATALTGCTASGASTHCSGGTSPVLMVLDATGSSPGWAVSEYLSANTLPSGTVLHFNGAGSSTMGWSQASPVGTDPFAATTPAMICDYASTCTSATAATTCSHAGLGFSSCPSYAVTMGGSGAANQVDLFSANAGTGMGANCFASGTATAMGCTSATPTAFLNMGVKGNATAGSSSATINMAVNSGP
jgi:hypothetical protein